MHTRSDLDVIGATLSVACAVHCLAAPVLVSFVPYLFGPNAERLLGILLFGIASVAIGLGVRQHRDFRVLEWSGDDDAVKEIARYSSRLKPEGIARAMLNGTPRTVIVFDTSRFTLLD